MAKNQTYEEAFRKMFELRNSIRYVFLRGHHPPEYSILTNPNLNTRVNTKGMLTTFVGHTIYPGTMCSKGQHLISDCSKVFVLEHCGDPEADYWLFQYEVVCYPCASKGRLVEPLLQLMREIPCDESWCRVVHLTDGV